MNRKWPVGLKRTKTRLAVLEALDKATQPLSAAEILRQITGPGKTGWYSTVYRILQTFVAAGLAAETSLPGRDAHCYELIRDVHQHYARCEMCRNIFPLEACPVDLLAKALPDFHILSHRIELSGLCQDCYRKSSGNSRKESQP